MVSNIFQRTGAPRTGVMGAAGEMSALAGGQFGAGSEWGRAADAGGPSRSLSLLPQAMSRLLSNVLTPHPLRDLQPPKTDETAPIRAYSCARSAEPANLRRCWL